MNIEKEKILDDNHSSIFTPKTNASKLLIPLLDSLNWQGKDSRIAEAIVGEADYLDMTLLIETMANLNFRYKEIHKVNAEKLDPRLYPLIISNLESTDLLVKSDGDMGLIYDTSKELYLQKPLKHIYGTAYIFQYAEDMKDSLIHQQNNWFNKLLYRFKDSLSSMILLSFFMTILNLIIPFFIIMIYDQISTSGENKALIITFSGVILYVISSGFLDYLRNQVINYVSTRMGFIISLQTFTRLLYLSPSYTETASINSQVNRIKDFENLKRFVTSGIFINLIELVFSTIYVIAIFYLAGWLGIIPIITLIVVMLLGFIMRPFHKIKMESLSETAAQKQQNLIEILKNRDEIKVSGLKDNWIKRNEDILSENIYNAYELSNYVNMTNSISYFITNASVLIIIYNGIIQVFNGKMTMGILIGVMMLYWKVLNSIRGAFSLTVQVNGLLKSIAQINRFMKLPQDSNLKTSMAPTNPIKGKVKFVDVSLKYNQSSNPALLGVNFSVQAGEILGIHGHDGAGKTTILKLILAMYKPQGGRVILDNTNIKQLEPLSLRQSISYSSEKDMIFTGTIRDNFKYYNPTISDDQLLDLIKSTALDKYMTRYNFTLDTLLSDNQISDLSMSFKKLFNLTRMLTRDVKLYLIDEPENYLNHEEIQNFISLITKLSRHKYATVIISTKDESILDCCDQVVKLNQGRIQKAGVK